MQMHEQSNTEVAGRMQILQESPLSEDHLAGCQAQPARTHQDVVGLTRQIEMEQNLSSGLLKCQPASVFVIPLKVCIINE